MVGGGPCGLTAALAGTRRGLSVELVESTSHLGGMAASLTVAGQRVDLGSHRLHSAAAPQVLDLVSNLLGSDLQVRRRDGRLRLRDRWVRFPLRPADMIRSMPPSFVVGAAADALTSPFRRARNGSYGELVRSGLGPSALAEFHGPMAAKLWGLPPDQLDGELARKRIPLNTPTRVAAKVASTVRDGGGTFLYPRFGYGQIVERLADEAARSGARLRTGSSVVALTETDGGSTAVLSNGNSVTGKRVLWTAPMDALATVVTAADSTDASTTLRRTWSPPMRGVVLVYLALDRPQYTPFDAHYIPTPEVAFSRFSEPKNYRDGPDPTDRTVLCFEIPATVGDETWEADENALTETVLDGLARLGLPKVPVAETAVRRLPSVYPVVTVDDPRPPSYGECRIDSVPGVTVLGRQGLAVADNLHHVLDMALSAVDCIDTRGGWSDADWSGHRRRFAGFQVED